MKTLKYHSTDNGNCCVYYKDTNKENKTLYCMQLETRRPHTLFNLLVCSRDGEPSHKVDMNNYTIPLSQGDESTDTELNNFLNIQTKD